MAHASPEHLASVPRDLLETIASHALDAAAVIDEWLGSASTRQAATDALWRLTRTLERAGLTTGYRLGERWSPAQFRGVMLAAHERAGVGMGEDDEVRLRCAGDPNYRLATGPKVGDLLAARGEASDLLGQVLSHETIWDSEAIRGRVRRALGLILDGRT